MKIRFQLVFGVVRVEIATALSWGLLKGATQQTLCYAQLVSAVQPATAAQPFFDICPLSVFSAQSTAHKANYWKRSLCSKVL